MSFLFGSVESVVFPVPESPKNTAVSPDTGSMFAEQCIGSTSKSGIKRFITQNTIFLISPEYLEPHIIPIFFSKLIIIAASECVPSSSGLHWNPGAAIIVKSSFP